MFKALIHNEFGHVNGSQCGSGDYDRNYKATYVLREYLRASALALRDILALFAVDSGYNYGHLALNGDPVKVAGEIIEESTMDSFKLFCHFDADCGLAVSENGQRVLKKCLYAMGRFEEY